MKNKLFKYFSLRLYFTLIVMITIAGTLATSWSFTGLLDKFFNITVIVPTFVWYIIFSLIIGTTLARFLSQSFFAPITHLGNAMSSVADGDFSISLKTDSIFKEIRDIYRDFNLMTKELNATEILQTDFVSNVSHEFKTPINAIEGYTMLLQDSTLSENEREQYIEKILFNTGRLSNLVGNILLLSKVDNQAILSKQTAFRLDEQIRQSIVILEPAWSKKDIDFDVDLEEIIYCGNEAIMLHIWNNLIENAVKFVPYGGFIRIRLEQQDNKIVFTIEDNGSGISDSDKTHIFNKFYQSDSSHKEEGNGLGLSLVKNILTRCGGTINAYDSTLGGAKFIVTL